VSDHQQYSKAVMDTQEWLEATHNTVLLWGDTDLERILVHTNVERLKVLTLGSTLFFPEAILSYWVFLCQTEPPSDSS